MAQGDLEAARAFLESDPMGRRLQGAEHALTLLLKGELPRLKQFIFGSTVSLRRVEDPDGFDAVANEDADSNALLQGSQPGGHMRVDFARDHLRLLLFYTTELSDVEAKLYSRSFAEYGALTYGALGLDMSGRIAVDDTRLSGS